MIIEIYTDPFEVSAKTILSNYISVKIKLKEILMARVNSHKLYT